MDKFIVPIIIIAIIAFFYFRSSGTSEAAKENIRLGAEFLASNKLNEGVLETASGIQYKVLTKGDGQLHATIDLKT